MKNNYELSLELKAKLVTYLKTKNIDSISALWGEAKTYYNNKVREMGGSYSSSGKHISVRLNNLKNNTPIRFDVTIKELQ